MRVLTIACLALAVLIGSAWGRDRLTRVQPAIATTVKGSGPKRVLAIRVTDFETDEPLANAKLDVLATNASGARVTPRVDELQPGVFRCSLTFPSGGRWRVAARVSGPEIKPAEFSVNVDVAGVATGDGSGGHGPAFWIGVPIAAVAGLAVLGAAGLRLRRRRAR